MSQSSESGYSSDECQLQSPNNAVIARDAKLFARKYCVEDELMKSANGVLYTGFQIKTGRPVVIKQIPRNVISKYEIVGSRMVPSEIYMHAKAYEFSKSVVEPLDWFERRSSFVLVLEKPENSMDLFEFSKKFGRINEGAAKVIFKQIVECSNELFRGGLIHRDLKDENILINPQTLEIKVIDFGCATVRKPLYTSCSGTPEFWPSEWYQTRSYEPEPLTVYSLGAILYILLVGEWNFQNGSHRRNFLDERHLSPEATSILESMLCSNPSKRASFKKVLNSKFLSV